MRGKNYQSLAVALLVAWLPAAAGADGLRGSAPIDSDAPPPPMEKPIGDDIRQVRNYPEQPPVIPHSIRGYQVDLRFNKCMTCHSRTAAPEAGAPMVSVTHYMNRDGQVLTQVSPRRYFCTQCHVPQTTARPLVGNTFVGSDE